MEFLSAIDWVTLGKIIMIDIVLGGDNALVIAMACAAVPLHQRRKAIFWGTAAAIAARIIVLAFAAFVIKIPFVNLIAGLALMWIGYKLVCSDDNNHEIEAKDNMYAAIKTIAFADLVMSIDNVFAVTGAAQSTGDHGIYYAIFGILLSIPIIIFGANVIGKIIERFPVVVWFGAAMIIWIGAGMVATDSYLALSNTYTTITQVLSTLLLVFFAYIVNKKTERKGA